MGYELHNVDCFDWLTARAEKSIHAVITDPPYGLKEYSDTHITKRNAGRGGVWRIPPRIGGYQRKPLPRFTVLTEVDRADIAAFFRRWGQAVLRVLVPGGHVFIASNPLLSPIVFEALSSAGLERRGEIVRLVRTFRGGDRPKGGEREFPHVSAMPRSAWEPWGLFRRPLDGTLVDNLRAWSVGGLRRTNADSPFCDVIASAKTPRREREIADHPSLKPQAFLRSLARAALPMGVGVVLDPFMGAGSTIAACHACGIDAIGLELRADYFAIAKRAIPPLTALDATDGRTTSPSATRPRRPTVMQPEFRMRDFA